MKEKDLESKNTCFTSFSLLEFIFLLECQLDILDYVLDILELFRNYSVVELLTLIVLVLARLNPILVTIDQLMQIFLAFPHFFT